MSKTEPPVDFEKIFTDLKEQGFTLDGAAQEAIEHVLRRDLVHHGVPIQQCLFVLVQSTARLGLYRAMQGEGWTDLDDVAWEGFSEVSVGECRSLLTETHVAPVNDLVAGILFFRVKASFIHLGPGFQHRVFPVKPMVIG